MKKNNKVWLLIVFLATMINGYSQMKTGGPTMVKVDKAICVLYPTQGNNVSGTITFSQTDKGVRVVADIQGSLKGNMGFIFMNSGIAHLQMASLLADIIILKGRCMEDLWICHDTWEIWGTW